MLTFCLKCKRYTQIVDSKMLETKNGRLLLSKCAIYGSKKIKIYERTRSRRIFK